MVEMENSVVTFMLVEDSLDYREKDNSIYKEEERFTYIRIKGNGY